jgi:hypothetical protein
MDSKAGVIIGTLISIIIGFFIGGGTNYYLGAILTGFLAYILA